MNLLIFLVSVLFSFVFYFFYLLSNNKSFLGYNFNSSVYFESLSGNLLIESIVFIIIGILLYLYFSDFSFKKSNNIIDKQDVFDENMLKKQELFFTDLNLKNILKFSSTFFKQYLYYIGFIFFYLGIYFIYKSLNLEEFSYVLFFVNIIVLGLFFITHKFFIFRDFIKINLILFSVYYLVFYVYNFFLNYSVFPVLDIINSLFILLSFLLVFYNDNKILKINKLDNALLYYFFFFMFSFISFSIYSFINVLSVNHNISFILFIVSVILSFFSYFIFTKIVFLKNNIISLRVICFLLIYLASLIGIYYFIVNGFNFIISTILIYFTLFLYDTHQKFQNYISFFFSNFILVFLIYFGYFKGFFPSDDGLIFLILTLVLSLEAIIVTYFYDFKYKTDYYFFHMFSYFVNIFGIIYYLFTFKIDLFVIGIIFFVEAFYVFLSYFRLKQIKKLG